MLARNSFLPILSAEKLNTIVDIAFAVDLALCFFKAYENERGEVVTDMKKIRREYIRFWIWIDVPASIPFDTILSAIGYDLYGLKCFRLLRIGRVIKFLQKLQLTNVWNIVRLVAFFAFLAHWFGCIWYVIVDSNSAVDWDSLGLSSSNRRLSSNRDLGLDNTTFAVIEYERHQPWLEANLEHNIGVLRSVKYRWSVSIYSALCMLLGNDMGPVDSIEFCVHGLISLLGAVIQAYIFGQVALLIADQNSTAVQW
jgi:hypothetical protein